MVSFDFTYLEKDIAYFNTQSDMTIIGKCPVCDKHDIYANLTDFKGTGITTWCPYKIRDNRFFTIRTDKLIRKAN